MGADFSVARTPVGAKRVHPKGACTRRCMSHEGILKCISQEQLVCIQYVQHSIHNNNKKQQTILKYMYTEVKNA